MNKLERARLEIVTFDPIIEVPVMSLKLDIKNVRIVHIDAVREDDVDEHLRECAEALYPDIKKRGLQEPLELFPNSNVVAEGNCRLACLRWLYREASNPHMVKDDPMLEKFKNYKVLCRRITKKTPKANINAYLAEIHVGRKQKWPEFNQAQLLHTLYYDDNRTLEEIAHIVRSSRPTIGKKIQCYEFTKKYHEMFPDDKVYILKFYYFWEFMNKSLAEFRSKESNVVKFMKWLHSRKFRTSKMVRELSKVLDNKQALRKFEETDMDEAMKILIPLDPTIRSALYRNIHKLTVTLNQFSAKDVAAAAVDSSKQKMLEDLKITATKLLRYINEASKGVELK